MFCWYRSQTFNFSKIDMFYQTNIFLVMNIKLVLLINTDTTGSVLVVSQTRSLVRSEKLSIVLKSRQHQRSIPADCKLTASLGHTEVFSSTALKVGLVHHMSNYRRDIEIFIDLSHIWLIFLYVLSPHTARTYFTRLSPPGCGSLSGHWRSLCVCCPAVSADVSLTVSVTAIITILVSDIEWWGWHQLTGAAQLRPRLSLWLERTGELRETSPGQGQRQRPHTPHWTVRVITLLYCHGKTPPHLRPRLGRRKSRNSLRGERERDLYPSQLRRFSESLIIEQQQKN